MKKYETDKAASYILIVVLLVITSSIVIASRYYLYTISILMWAVFWICLAAFVFTAVWLILYFRNILYTVSPEEITKSAGVFFRKRQVMKPSAVQYVTLVTTPLSGFTGLNGVILNALGGNLRLLFLSKKDAVELQKILEEYLRIYS